MHKPIIGILPTYNASENMAGISMTYLDSCCKAGGAPMILPHTDDKEVVERLADLCDGFIFTGGPDVNPELFGEFPWYRLGGVSPMRDSTDRAFFETVYPGGKPMIGICRGLQFINVMLGGTLYQDIGSQYQRPEGKELLKHRQEEASYVKTHEAEAEPGSVIEHCWGSRFMVNSFHHQAIKDLAPGAVVTALSEDGIIEAMSVPSHNFLHCVQWHPEGMTPQDEGARRFFAAFVDACRKKPQI